jgi:hypothetical protein
MADTALSFHVSLKSEPSLTQAKGRQQGDCAGPNPWPKYLQRYAAAFVFRFNRAQRESAAAAPAKSTGQRWFPPPLFALPLDESAHPITGRL